MRGSHRRILPDRALERLQRGARLRAVRMAPELIQPFEVRLLRRRVRRLRLRQPRRLRLCERRADVRRDGPRDIRLEREQIAQRTLEALRPQIRVAPRANHVNVDAHPRRRVSRRRRRRPLHRDGPVDDRPHAEPARDLLVRRT